MKLAACLALVIAAAVAACGPAPAASRPIEGRDGDGEGGTAVSEDPVTILRVLAAAAELDDGTQLDALIHPEHGAWLWLQPGAYIVPTVRLTAGAKTPPSQRLTSPQVIDYWREALWPTVARQLATGLTVLDRDPADRRDPKYGTCDDGGDGSGSAQRTWLAPDELGPYHEEIAAEAKVELPAVMREALLHYRQWGLDVWMMRAEGRLWVAHVMVWTPCDA